MKNTKCLFDEQTQTSEGMVSVSQLQTYMSCPKKWEYSYLEKLEPRIERPYLGIGKLCHKGMQVAMEHYWQYSKITQGYRPEQSMNVGILAMREEHARYMESHNFLAEELPDIQQVLIDAVSVFIQAFQEFDVERYEVLTLQKSGVLIPALELHFVVPCASSKGLHGYIDAILIDRETKSVWCTDYKFRKSLSPDDEEAVNIQNAVYMYACKKMDIKITGTLTWQHCNTPAADPQILKNGQVSRAKIKTTWKHYEQFCKENGIDPRPYAEEMTNKFDDIEWYRGTYEYRNDITIKNMWDEVIVPATRKVQKARNPKTKNNRHLYPWNCKMCQFKDLCQSELRCHDADYLRDTEYVLRTSSR